MGKTTFLSIVLCLVFVISLLPSIFVQNTAVQASIPSSIGSLEGPYFNTVQFKIYATTQAETAGLLTGDVDVVDFFEASQVPDIQAGLTAKTLNISQGAEQGMWGWSIQCQRYPLNITQFRRAIAHLVDKDKIVSEGLQGLAYKLEPS